MAKFWIYPYTQNSEGAIAIAAELEGKRILREGSSYSYKTGDVIINWGASDCPYPQALNHDNKAVLNKNKFFKRLDGTGLTPVSCITFAGAQGMTFPVVCRQKVEGRDGAGIVIADTPADLVDARLYVEYVNKSREYRIHVGRLPNGQTKLIGSQKKIVDGPSPGLDSRVWAGSGTRFVWTVDGSPVIVPQSVVDCVLAAFDHFPELTFGAFDAVYCNDGRTFVLEINSAPMVTPETAKRYGKFFRELASLPTATAQVLVQAPPTAPVVQPSPVPATGGLNVTFDSQSITQTQLTKLLLAVPGVIGVQ